MQRLYVFWIGLRSSLWFVPGLMLAGSIVLALALVEIDSTIDGQCLEAYPRVFGLGADGSRGMLTAIAASMLTVAALAFSLTLNAVTQASAQFTPRVFRNFLRDRANQFVLGYFVSVFAFCLIVLRTIRGGDEIRFVPSISVLIGLLLSLGGVIVLIFFIHHIASSLQITSILDGVVRETKRSIKKMFPKESTDCPADRMASSVRSFAERTWRPVPALSAGYIQSVDLDGLLDLAAEHRAVLRIERTIGEFVGRGAPLASISSESGNDGHGDEQCVSEDQFQKINARFGIARHRTIEQDVSFGIRQIVDVALKALSPGVNDTTTAVTCIDFLGEIMGEIARRKMPPKIRSKDHVPRLIVSDRTFADYAAAAFDQIRISGRGNVAVFERLLSTLTFVAGCTRELDRQKAVHQQVVLIEEFALQTLATDYEKDRVRAKAAKALGALRCDSEPSDGDP